MDQFLTAYKDLEAAIASKGNISTKYAKGSATSVYELEEITSDEDIKNKLRICRMMRNYAQHNADYNKFLSVTDQQTAFLEDVYDDITGTKRLVKDNMTKTTKPLTTKNNLSDALEMFVKRTDTLYLPVVDKDGKLDKVVSIRTISKDVVTNTLRTPLSKATAIPGKYWKKIGLLDDYRKLGDGMFYVVVDEKDAFKGYVVK